MEGLTGSGICMFLPLFSWCLESGELLGDKGVNEERPHGFLLFTHCLIT